MKRIICAVISVLMIISTFAFFINAAEKSGVTFAVDELYRTAQRLDKHPHTYEAWVKVAKNAPSSELGVVAGNYTNGKNASYGFEIRKNGNPFLWMGYGGSGTDQRLSFDKVDLRTGEWTHVAVTFDSTTAYCYVNGELKQTLSAKLPDVDMTRTDVLCIGGDLRSGNGRWLKNTELSSVALYSDMRTADEIKADMAQITLDDADILAAYDFSARDTSILKDISPKGRDLNYNGKLLVGEQEDTEKGGMAFTADMYKLIKKIDQPINTVEATVYFPKNYIASQRGGVIIGNYGNNAANVNFEIYSNGSPRFYITDKSGTVYNFVFDKVNVFNGEWTHIAIVRENSSTLKCYVNGELAQTISKSSPNPTTSDFHILGGDLRSGNDLYFKGRLKGVALYSDARTADEVKADMTTAGKDGLICSYELDGLTAPAIVSDKSGNGFDAKLKVSYFTEKAPLEDYAYSFAVLGDTQILAESYPDKFTALYDWVLGNVEAKKIKFVLGLGDITNSSTNAEFDLAKKNIERMNGVVPYSLVRGNHDTENQMKKYFPVSAYKDKLGGYYGSDIFNSWQELIVGEIKYLIFTLDYGAKDAVLNWASEIIAAHPEHNVIITTHAYLFRDGTTLDSGDVVPPSNKGSQYNNGDHMWDKLIKKHENIVLVLSGHDPCDYVVAAQDKGTNGNIVTQMLVDPQGVDKAQGGVGLVTMLYFSADGKTMQVETYSTDKKAYFLEENQFTLTLDLAEGKAPETTAQEITAEVTEVPETQPEVTEAPSTEAPTTEPIPEEKGCGASVSLAIVPMILLALPAFFKRRREE
ncbi:MAG: metallophosphoesterase [Clostridia bacterium]|nr:metallophosphoesterase [Clostridia bacterium]